MPYGMSGGMRGGNQGMAKSIRSVVWMLGLAYLFWRGNWWPGILVLVGISMLLDIVLKSVFAATSSANPYDEDEFSPPMRSDEMDDESLSPDPIPSTNNNRMQRLDPDPIPPAKNLSREYRVDLLPPSCPNCGAPISQKEVEFVGIKTAKCGFCGSNFSLSE